MRHHDITAGGNFEGHNIPNVPSPPGRRPGSTPRSPRPGSKLYEVRARRVPPLRDDKVLAAWNGLMISGAGGGGPGAGRAPLRRRRRPRGRLPADPHAPRRPAIRPGLASGGPGKDGQLTAQGFLEDQAFVVQGCWICSRAASDGPAGCARPWPWPTPRSSTSPTRAAGGWFMTANDAEVLIAREKPAYDGAEPSGTSIALLNALRLHTFTTDDRWRQVADRGFASVAAVLRAPAAGPDRGAAGAGLPPDVPRELARGPPARRFRG